MNQISSQKSFSGQANGYSITDRKIQRAVYNANENGFYSLKGIIYSDPSNSP